MLDFKRVAKLSRSLSYIVYVKPVYEAVSWRSKKRDRLIIDDCRLSSNPT